MQIDEPIEEIEQEIWIGPMNEDNFHPNAQDDDNLHCYLFFLALGIGYLSARLSRTFRDAVCISAIYFLEAFLILFVILYTKTPHCHKPLNEVSMFFFVASFTTLMSFLLFYH